VTKLRGRVLKWHQCHTSHAKWRSTSPSATPATQSDDLCVCVSKLCGDKLCVSKVCGDKLCVSKLYVNKLLVTSCV